MERIPINNFIKVKNEDPHIQRRKAILKLHPEVKALCGYEPMTKYIVAILFIVQMVSACFVVQLPIVFYLLYTYIVGATINHILYIAIHDISHNLACRKAWQNALLAIFANLPIGFPVAMAFKRYHLQHHRFLGKLGHDVDLPLQIEALYINSLFKKILWLLLQPITYGLRPYFISRSKMSLWEYLNISMQLIFDIAIVCLIGWKALLYFVLSALFGMSLHPTALHFIAEHYVVNSNQETYSYYGPLNKISFNVGYHVEHHDFPSIPWSRLPKLHQIAAEFYEKYYAHSSLIKNVCQFIYKKNITLFSRVTRKTTEGANQ